MAGAQGGPVESIAINNRNFAITEDSDASVDYGGDKNEILMNGDGTGRQSKSKKPWKVSGLGVVINPDNDDHEFLQDVIDKNGFVDYEHTESDGNTYYAKGQIVEDMEKSTKTASMEITCSGAGKLKKQ